MGQLIDEEDCEVCVPFDQEWIFTYGDLVTLLLCFSSRAPSLVRGATTPPTSEQQVVLIVSETSLMLTVPLPL